MIDTMERTSIEICEASGITYRQLDWYIRNHSIPTTPAMDHPGSGNHRLIPDWYIPRLRLLGRIQRAFAASSGSGGLPGTVLRDLFDHYNTGRLDLGDGISITWKVES